MIYYRISKNEKNLFFGKKNRPGVGSDLNIQLVPVGTKFKSLDELLLRYEYFCRDIPIM